MQTADAQLLVMCALARGPRHGYAINTTVKELTGERLGRGSLSSALARLQAKALVEPLQEQGRQRPLRLTQAGREVLEQELHSAARVTQRMFEAAAPDKVHYQERLAASETGRAYRDVMLRALAARPGQTVLYLGCGTGSDFASLAEAVTASGIVLGIDHDPAMAGHARERARGLGQAGVLQADAHALPLRAASVDRARTDRVLQHVADPGQVLAEARRVLRPGGRLVMAEPDWESLVFDHPDRDASRAYTRHLTERIVRNALIGRQVPRLAARAGFEVSDVVPVTAVLRDPREADRILGLQRNARRAVENGYLTAATAQRWLDGLAEEPFLAAVTLYVVVANQPAR